MSHVLLLAQRSVVRTLRQNTETAQAAIAELARTYDAWHGAFAAHHALRDALITAPEHIDAQMRLRLAPLLSKYLR